MLFNTVQFAAFFAVVLGVYRVAPARVRNDWLLACSLVFYALWIPVYLFLLLADAGLNYVLLRRIAHSKRPKLHLAASVILTLGVLAYYKYAAFLLGSLSPLFGSLSENTSSSFEILLPLGISFYSFQIVALAVDAYRGSIEPPQSFRRYLLFVCFFPQLIAGPILRGSEFLPQLAHGGSFSSQSTRRGLWLIASGLAKKVIFGDFLLAPFVNAVYAHPGLGGAPVHLLAVYSFAFQIYFDFAGYTDMARGMACLLGFELPPNFQEPYLSRNPAEFWRRWHMTLSRWLRDYLYIPLGGNRAGPGRTYVNLMTTMVLGGLWHGAGWTFVVWGGLHGLLLAVHRWGTRTQPDGDRPFRPSDAWKVLLLFHCVCLLWIFFRAATFGDAFLVLSTVVTGNYLVDWPILPTLVVVLCGIFHCLERVVRVRLRQVRRVLDGSTLGAALEGALLGIVVSLTIAASGIGAEFIYFQF